ncbi:uncharacterized protein SPAPADRAFT_61422 [Spathaspora passalidarum NRRL Y-27907]|uniref:protein-histidine N-methyltransferase n=1 Tax=Spathaspora passalidarum (strain NRRL Y-27907 / 11-Y1) TaxID=619300 RepID=G3AQ22_SPAPN|nr:uncharacterized protein SPAPADRAFT_61422 [Spathaspora passalidarum NRRL Y-27907]EGW32343.1 hypothetical protein SPAPADRAFT_61422 [Spathaspora passalidarum NRRL Y-27907]
MSFSFGFTNDDLSGDELDQSSTPSQPPQARALDTLVTPKENLPQRHTLAQLCSTLLNVRITFDNYTTPGGNLIYRRELFDVKHQIMSEDEGSTQLGEMLLDEQSDLQRNVYEGGFKSWECAYDAVDKLASGQVEMSSVLEYGCGTALPSCFILLRKFTSGDKNSLRITLSDFNYDVLRLVTLPNLIINWASTLPVEKLHALTTSEENPVFNNDEVLLTQQLIQEFTSALNEFNIELDFISGAWGNQFNELVTSQTSVDFMISSETIYSPDILPVVAESIVEILSRTNGTAKCMVAAKNIYFGVGGSVIEFVNYFDKVSESKFIMEVEEINDSQLKRSLVMIEKK